MLLPGGEDRRIGEARCRSGWDWRLEFGIWWIKIEVRGTKSQV